MDLHAVLTARIDELERWVAVMDRHLDGHERPYAPDDPTDPTTVLRGLAEDRDILRRHRPSAEPVPTPRGEFTICVYCSDIDSPVARVVGWPCWDAISLARRHGIEVVDDHS